MSAYYVNKNAQANGDHEVHKTGCSYMPNSDIRVFNLLVELDHMGCPVDATGTPVKAHIIARCEDNQREIQTALVGWARTTDCRPYPAEKLSSLVRLLADCLSIEIDHYRVGEEVTQLCDMFSEQATVPFRDATTKNMVLAAPELWLGNFSSEDERRRYLRSSMDNCHWLDAPIVDFDFASCVNTTTPEDDVISLRYHERTWEGAPQEAEDLVWTSPPDPKRAAITFLIRYYRFGGRKAAYRLLHPSGHRIRFRHDNDVFYFEHLEAIMRQLWPEVGEYYPEMIRFTNTAAKQLRLPTTSVDFFRADRFAEQRRYYVDMFPE